MRNLHRLHALWQDDKFVNELAVEWYFLNAFFLGADPLFAETVVEPLIEAAAQLKPILNAAGHTYLTPRNICLDENVYFDIWLDADGDIGFSALLVDE